MTNLLADARRLTAAGISVIPLRQGSKTPGIPKWAPYQERIATDAELSAWFGPGSTYGLAIVTGAVSGNLEMTEIEGRALPLLGDVMQLAGDSGLGPLMQKVGGWLEKSPSGGLHWFYRLPEVPAGNTKVARRKATADELVANPGEKVKVLSETRGEHGYVVAAPTDYGTAGRWEIIGAGGPHSMPTLTAEEREDFHTLLGTMGDQDAAPEPGRGTPVTVFAAPAGPTNGIFDGLRPGDDFNERTSWEQLLEPAGWTKAFDFPGGGIAWRRPGKKDYGISASTGRDPEADRLFVFSTSTELPDNQPIDKFGYYTLMNHNGDFSAASRALKAQNFGREPERVVQAAQPQPQAPATDGNVAYMADYAPVAAPAPDVAAQPSTTPQYSDDANALLLVDEAGDRLRYNSTAGRWLLWTGMVWEEQPKGGGRVCEVGKEVARAMRPADAKGQKHKTYSLSVGGNTAMLKFASTDPRITVTPDQLDAEGWELNTPGGIVDLTTGERGPSDPAKLHTRITKVTPADPAVRPFEGSRFQQFIRQTFLNNEEMATYVQRLLGASIIGAHTDEILPFALGGGGNGKTALFEMVAGVLGQYADSTPPNFLMAQRNEKHSTEVADLSGKRFVMCSEVNEDDKFDEAKVKLLTGGDRLKARFLNQDFFTFEPTHQLWLAGNYYPAVGSGGDSFWRRLRLIPFDYTVPKAERQPQLAATLIAEEGDIILRWMVDGAVWRANNNLLDHEPAAVRARTEEYAESEDNVTQFVNEKLELHRDAPLHHTVTVAKMYEAYEVWCRHNSEKAISKRSLGARLSTHGVLTEKDIQKLTAARATGGVTRYGGVSFRASEEEEDRPFSY